MELAWVDGWALLRAEVYSDDTDDHTDDQGAPKMPHNGQKRHNHCSLALKRRMMLYRLPPNQVEIVIVISYIVAY
jgi:hypothetical protein